MGTFVWLYSPRTNSPHLTMNSFVVLSTLLAAACAAPQLVNQGPQSGPLTPVVGGDLVATPKGFRSIALEGFSEDLNEDGFVDPIAPAAPAPIVVPQPIFNTAPVAVAPQVFSPHPLPPPNLLLPSSQQSVLLPLNLPNPSSAMWSTKPPLSVLHFPKLPPLSLHPSSTLPQLPPLFSVPLPPLSLPGPFPPSLFESDMPPSPMSFTADFM